MLAMARVSKALWDMYMEPISWDSGQLPGF